MENGVGMIRDFLAGLEEALAGAPASQARAWPGHVVIATGKAAADLFNPYLAAFSRLAGCPVSISPVANKFFGETVTVAGLLTGQDLLEQLQGRLDQLKQAGIKPLLLLPESMFRAGEEIMLDDLTREQLAAALGVIVIIVPARGADLVRQLQLIGAGQGGV